MSFPPPNWVRPSTRKLLHFAFEDETLFGTLDIYYDPLAAGDWEAAQSQAEDVLDRLHLTGHECVLLHYPPFVSADLRSGFYRVHVAEDEAALAAIAGVMREVGRVSARPTLRGQRYPYESDATTQPGGWLNRAVRASVVGTCTRRAP